ncbi:MAG TPA: hypothetical protein VM240_13645 [Verrucomicrobiae bacterium]|nr:hypothetical protein [Verrucomicrobiae bacterium]
MRRERIPLVAVAWLAALVPALAANLAYLISAYAELVPWCVPYLEGCTSVSRAARHGVAAPVFKALMLPYCVVLATFWWLAARWLGAVRPERRRTQRALPMLGLVAAIATATYALALGVDGELYQWLRRYGINLSFALTVLAELLLAAALVNEPRVPRSLRRAMIGLCLAMLMLGLASLPLQYLVADRHAALNAIEWTYSLLMLAFFPLVGAAWRRTPAQP